jgi:hypothetical protein
MTPFEWAMIAMAIIGTGVSVDAQKKSSDAQESAFKRQADEEESASRERELARKEKVNHILAAQIVGLSASGITGEGSPTTIATESVRQESLEGLADVATRSGRKRNLTNQASAARSLGNINAISTGITGLSNAGILANKAGAFD